MLKKPETRELKAFNYNAIIHVDIMCPETGKSVIEDYKVNYYAGGIEPDKKMLVDKILRKVLHERRGINKK
jgi:hypothetical protein